MHFSSKTVAFLEAESNSPAYCKRDKSVVLTSAICDHATDLAMSSSILLSLRAASVVELVNQLQGGLAGIDRRPPAPLCEGQVVVENKLRCGALLPPPDTRRVSHVLCLQFGAFARKQPETAR